MKKYSILFIIVIILIKIVYLFFESDYNAELLNIVSDPNSTKEILEGLEKYGHRLSSIGLTLLVVPFLYLFLKKFIQNQKIYLGSLFLISIGIYNLTYSGLTHIVDEFVERNKHLQYNSYYTTMFKYGMLKQEMGYSSFIPKERLEHISIEDKVMIANIFLLVETDKELIKKIVENKDNTIKSVLISEKDNKFKEDFKKSESKFNAELKKFDDMYKNYMVSSNSVIQKISELDNEKKFESLYSNFKQKLETKYKNYLEVSDKAKKDSYPSEYKIDEYYKDLSEYFKYQKYERAKKKYTETMYKRFGTYIEPNRWCDENCPSRDKIRQVIQEEVAKKWKNKMGDIPRSLSSTDFLKYPSIRKQVVLELRKEGLNVTDDFNYSKESFAKAYKNSLKNSEEKIAKDFENEIYKQTNKKIKMGLSYENFVAYWKDDIVKEYGNNFGLIIFNMIKDKDSTNYYKDFYKPYIESTIGKKYIINENQFEDDEYKEKGDYAIKSMFVVPFAIFMSLFAGVLNLISVIVLSSILLLRFITNDKKIFIISNSIRVVLLVILIYYPYKIGKDNNLLGNYKILENKENIQNNFVKLYIESLNWVLVVEKINYQLWNKNQSAFTE